MKKTGRLGRRLLYLTGAVLLLLLWQQLGLPCLFRTIIGIPCPGCGLTRAWLAALRLDLSTAFRWHPMFWSIPILGVCIVFDGQIFKNTTISTVIVGICATGFLVVYLARLLGALGGFSLI